MGWVIGLLVLWVVLAVVGIAVKSLFWLAIVEIILFVADRDLRRHAPPRSAVAPPPGTLSGREHLDERGVRCGVGRAARHLARLRQPRAGPAAAARHR